ncbi:ATP-binding protein [Paractinoplanes atraurantiacus]|uniref:Anti-sigma regulatory factor (Ser/Thr protein kinase) n=1 Tax=Paractinoplanes atraurantiacus TaxID=1036182 RepID=A0A285JUV4_9ACTN|nr:ATP-binding protein [Actinoplanes atraurantiacus]SNY64104.1 Anti-sigma regulatory factor (Ser/Thr protein kinase) [Actinoplanes atraurantiacus]
MMDGVRPAADVPTSARLHGSRVLLSERFTESTVSTLRHSLTAAVDAAGVTGAQGEDFVLAVHELVTNAVQHGGGAGVLRLRRVADVLTCEVTDHGRSAGGLTVRLSPIDQAGGRGLWLAHHLTGSLILTRRADGVTASVSVCAGPSPAPSDAARQSVPYGGR